MTEARRFLPTFDEQQKTFNRLIELSSVIRAQWGIAEAEFFFLVVARREKNPREFVSTTSYELF